MKQENIVEKALAILNRQPEKLKAVINAEIERAAVLSRIRAVWRRLFDIDVDSKRRNQPKLLPLEDHLKHRAFQQPTPFIDLLLAEIDATPKPKSPSRSFKPGEYVPSDKPGITNFDVFNVFGPEARGILSDKEIGEVLGDISKAPIELGACEHCSRDDVPAWRRGGRIVERFWPDGHRDFKCHFCGRAVKDPTWRMIRSKNEIDANQGWAADIL